MFISNSNNDYNEDKHENKKFQLSFVLNYILCEQHHTLKSKLHQKQEKKCKTNADFDYDVHGKRWQQIN